MLLVELMRCARVCLLTLFLSLTCQMLTHTQWCWQMLTNMNIEENGQCKSFSADADRLCAASRCWQRSADRRAWEFVPYQLLTHYAITPPCALGFSHWVCAGCIDIGHTAELDSPWCSPISSLVGLAIGSSAVLQSAKHAGGTLCVPGVRVSSKCSYSPTSESLSNPLFRWIPKP